MSTEIIIHHLNEKGQLCTKEMHNECLRMLGKDEDYLDDLKRALPDLETPVSITYLDMFDGPTVDKELAVASIERLRKLSASFSCCVTPSEEIVEKRDAVFSVQGYSYNEVLFTMFHFRALMNDYHCSTRMAKLPSSPLKAMEKLQKDYACTWEQAYLLTMAPSIQDGIAYYHVNGDDSCCYHYGEISQGRMLSWLRGEMYDERFDLSPKDEDMAWHLDQMEPYPRNIARMLDGGEGSVMENLYEDLSQAYRSVNTSASTGTLFNPSTSSSTDDPIQAVVDKLKELL